MRVCILQQGREHRSGQGPRARVRLLPLYGQRVCTDTLDAAVWGQVHALLEETQRLHDEYRRQVGELQPHAAELVATEAHGQTRRDLIRSVVKRV